VNALVISADCHAGPGSMEEFRPYLESRWRADFDEYLACIDEYERANGSGGAASSRPASGGAGVRDTEFADGLSDPGVRRRYLDADGIAGEVLFPQGSAPFAPYPAVATPGGGMPYSAPVELRNEGPKAYNRWLAEFCSHEPARHAGVAIVPIRDVDESVAAVEAARAAGLFGGISLPPLTGPDILPYNDPAYDRLWACCQDLGMTVNMHGGARQSYGTGPDATALVLAETDWFSHRALWFLIFSGVFERFPNLHVAMTEQRTHWVGPLLRELDSIFHSPITGGVRSILTRLPSEYFARNCYVGASFMSRLECDDRSSVGVDRIMWGSDFPHNEGTPPWTEQSLRWTFAGTPAAEVERMIGLNAAECYGFDVGALEAVARNIGPRLDDVLAPIDAPPTDPGVELSWGFRRTGPWS